MVRKVETGFPRFPERSCASKKMWRQSFDAAGAPGGGASCTGAAVCWAAAGARLGAAGFLAAASAEPAVADGRGEGDGAVATDGDAGVCGADGADAAAGSGVMMLTGGVEAAEGKSALVGLPVGIDGASVATGPGAAAAGIFHSGAYRAIRPS